MPKQEEINKRFDELFPHKIAEVVDDFGSTCKQDIKSFLHSEISLALAEREKEIVEMIRKKYYIIGSTGSSKDEEQDKVNKENVIKLNGYNEAITDIINLIKNNYANKRH